MVPNKKILRYLNTTNYQELGKAIEFAFEQVTPSHLCPVVDPRLLLYLIFLSKAIDRERLFT